MFFLPLKGLIESATSDNVAGSFTRHNVENTQRTKLPQLPLLQLQNSAVFSNDVGISTSVGLENFKLGAVTKMRGAKWESLIQVRGACHKCTLTASSTGTLPDEHALCIVLSLLSAAKVLYFCQ